MNASDLGLSTPPAVTSALRVASKPWRRVAARVAAGALAVLVVGAAVVGALLFDTDPRIFEAGWFVKELLPSVITFSAAGAVLILIRPARIVGWVLMASAALYAASVLSAGLWYFSFQEAWSFGPLLLGSSFATGSIAGWLAYILLPQLFPGGVLKGGLWRTLLIVSALLMVAQLALLALSRWWLNFHVAEADVPVEPVSTELAFRIVPRLGDLMTVIAVVALLERLRRGPRQRRRQLAGFAVVYLTTVGLGYLSWFTVDPEFRVTGLVQTVLYPPAVVVAIAFAMLRYGLYEVRPVVHRAAVYARVGGGLTAGFAAVYLAVLSGLSVGLAGGPYSWLIVVTALVVVLVADPVRRRLRLRLERRFLGERGEPLRVLARLDQLVATGRSEERAVFTSVAETVMAAMRSPGAAVLAVPGRHPGTGRGGRRRGGRSAGPGAGAGAPGRKVG